MASSPAIPADTVANVEIACEPDDTTLDEWRIRTYEAIEQSYRRRLSAYRNGISRLARAPRAARRIVRGWIKHGCVRLLLERHLEFTGRRDVDGGTPGTFDVAEPRCLKFFDDVFEWDEMSYRFQHPPGLSEISPEEDEEAPFPAFCRADAVSVTVPVSPARMKALLYFLAGGTFWNGDDESAPVLENDVALVNELKTVFTHRQARERIIGAPWEITVPTSIQIIDDGVPTAFFSATEPEKS